MGLRDKLKSKARGVFNRLSGEYSAAAPDEIKPFERPDAPNPDAEIQWARLKRPREKGQGAAAKAARDAPKGAAEDTAEGKES